MWRRVGLLWTDVSEELVASIFRAGTSNTISRSRYFFYPEDGGDTFLRNVRL
jgi:hypothetical protein